MKISSWLPIAAFLAVPLAAQNSFIGGYFGVSTLSGDARTDVTSTGARFSSYKPENGPSPAVFAGRHLTDFISLLGGYSWNRNSLLLASGATSPAEAYAQPYRATVHTITAEGLLYFRNRRSRLRPYLSTGIGLTRTLLHADGAAVVSGAPALPAQSITHTGPAFRSAVGIDFMVARHAALRYSFSETIQGNPISAALNPPAPLRLANFQNWFGVAFYF